MARIQESLDLDNPQGLQDKVFLYVMLYFCNRCRKNLQDITRETFVIHEDRSGSNVGFITMQDILTKNNRETDFEQSQGVIMIESQKNLNVQ